MDADPQPPAWARQDPEEQDASLPEDAPLLDEGHQPISDPAQGHPARQPLLSRLGISRIVLYCMLLNFLLEFSNSILTVPLISLYEASICQTYYGPKHGSMLRSASRPDESMCKIPAVQSELAFVRGWKAIFDTLAALFLSLPVGVMADRYGRQRVYLVILAGLIGGLLWIVFVASSEHIPLRLVWCSSLFYLIGGGNYAAEMALMVIVSDATKEVDRTRVFYYMYSCFILTELLGPPMAAVTAPTSNWIPIVIGVCSLGLCVPVTLLMGRTNSKGDSTRSAEAESTAMGQGNGSNDAPTQSGSASWQKRSPKAIEYLSFLKSRNMLLALPIFLIGTFRAISLRVLVTYTSVRFGWKLSQVLKITFEYLGTTDMAPDERTHHRSCSRQPGAVHTDLAGRARSLTEPVEAPDTDRKHRGDKNESSHPGLRSTFTSILSFVDCALDR